MDTETCTYCFSVKLILLQIWWFNSGQHSEINPNIFWEKSSTYGSQNSGAQISSGKDKDAMTLHWTGTVYHTANSATYCVQVLYNNKGYHSMPTYLNVLNNAILRANMPPSKGNPAAYGRHARYSC